MKKTDIAMIILIASLSLVFSYMAVSAIPGLKAPEEAVSVQTIPRYEAALTEPSTTIFSKNAINPTVDVSIGGRD